LGGDYFGLFFGGNFWAAGSHSLFSSGAQAEHKPSGQLWQLF
jgi:hypothetical protein